MLTKRVLALAACLGLAACSVSPRGENPFASAQRVEPSGSRWSGHVVERLSAGSYLYLRVERAGADPAWVVTAEALATDAGQVSVHALRRVDRFESKRLSRTFSPLFFAIVRKDET